MDKLYTSWIKVEEWSEGEESSKDEDWEEKINMTTCR